MALLNRARLLKSVTLQRKPSPIEFSVPYSLDDCAARLERMKGSIPRKRIKTQVTLCQVDGQTLKFTICKTAYLANFRINSCRTVYQNYVKVQIHGQIIRLGNFDSTLVTAKGKIHASTYLINLLLSVGFVLAIFALGFQIIVPQLHIVFAALAFLPLMYVMKSQMQGKRHLNALTKDFVRHLQWTAFGESEKTVSRFNTDP